MNRQVHTTFCDDIRHEVSGKLSYIGVYSGTMLIPTFPVTLPKLCLALNVVTAASNPFRKLILRIYKNDEILAEANVSEAELEKYVEPSHDDAENERKDRAHVFHSALVFSPLKIDAPCKLRVRVETEEGEIRGVGLTIEKSPPEAV